jgi:membrane protein
MSIRTIWELIRETFARWISDGAFQMSAAIAFYPAFSMTPALLILVALVGLFYGGNTAASIEEQVSEYVGADAAALVARAVASLTDDVGRGRVPTILAIATMLIGASAVFSQVLAAMNKVWRVSPRPGRGISGVLRDRFWPFTMGVVVSMFLLGSFLVSTVIQFYSVYVKSIFIRSRLRLALR